MLKNKKNKISFLLISLILVIFFIDSLLEKENINSKVIFIILLWLFSLGIILKEHFNFKLPDKIKKYIVMIYTIVILIELIVFLVINFNIYFLCVSLIILLIWLYFITLCFNLNNPLTKVIKFQFYFFSKNQYLKKQTHNIATVFVYIFCGLITIIFFRMSLDLIRYLY